ncbi:hypothetical protein C8R45DRAFT_921783 [Mycena sanguinolenta]|nr:hypothetical protein C8R45DRAFT_921783 [Mycena sanguinolenta]
MPLRRAAVMFAKDIHLVLTRSLCRQLGVVPSPKPVERLLTSVAYNYGRIVCRLQRDVFKDAKVAPPLLKVVTNAGLTNFKPLTIGSFGIIWTELGLHVAQGQGKNGKHDAVTEHANISALSHINVQLPPFTFLCRLSGAPIVTPLGIELTPEDTNLFKKLNSARPFFDKAVKLSRSRKKAKELDAEEEDTTVGLLKVLVHVLGSVAKGLSRVQLMISCWSVCKPSADEFGPKWKVSR